MIENGCINPFLFIILEILSVTRQSTKNKGVKVPVLHNMFFYIENLLCKGAFNFNCKKQYGLNMPMQFSTEEQGCSKLNEFRLFYSTLYVFPNLWVFLTTIRERLYT